MARKGTKTPTESTTVCVKYTGDGEYIIGVPTDDLHELESDEAASLIESGLYREMSSAHSHDAPPPEPQTTGDDS
jgi:hypothetical protein